MPGPVSHGGWRRHIRIARNAANDAYGALPAAPEWFSVPLLGDGMKVKASTPRFVPDTNYSMDYRRHVAIMSRQEVGGDITTLLWPQLALYLMDAGFLRVADAASPNNQDVYGHVIDHFTPPDPRRYYGVAVNSLRLTGTGTGDNDIQISWSCIGQREVENNGLTEGDFDYSTIDQVPFMFGHASIYIDSAYLCDVETFEITLENNIGDSPFIWNAEIAAGARCHAIANLRTISLSLSDLNNDDRFNEAIRDANNISFELLLNHPEGHIMQIILPSLYCEESDEDGTPSVQAMESPRLEARVADAGLYEGEDIVYAVDLGPTTTTLEMLTTTTAAP